MSENLRTIKFEGQVWELSRSFDEAAVRAALKSSYAEIENAELVSEDDGDVWRFVVRAGTKG